MADVTYRQPQLNDATRIYELVRNVDALDLNSWYHYAIFARDFADTSLVADVDGQFAGFVTGYIRPTQPDTLFLWQTATTLSHGVSNLGLNLIHELVQTVKVQRGVRYVEATVDPTNKAIAMLFRLLARQLRAEKKDDVLLEAANFDELEHDESLVRIGPLK